MLRYAKIKNSKLSPFTGNIYNYMTRAGYTKRSGAPTNYMIQLEGKGNRWYRVMNYCISNSGTLFVSTKENSFLHVKEWELSK